MHQTRPMVILLIILMILEGILSGIESGSSLATIKDGILLGFLFLLPALLLGGLVVLRQPWAVVGAVMYSTIALALDLATIVQEASQASPRLIILVLVLGSSLVNFLIMIMGGRCLLTFQPGERPPGSHQSNNQFPSAP